MTTRETTTTTYAIEVDGLRFEGASEREAKKALAAARRQGRKLAVQREEARKLAQTRAQANGYRILTRGSMASRWLMMPVGGPHGAIVEHVEDGSNLRVETIDGVSTWGFCEGVKVLGVLCDATGYAIAAFFEARDATAFAVGVARVGDSDEYVCQVADLPGVEFRHFAGVMS